MKATDGRRKTEDGRRKTEDGRRKAKHTQTTAWQFTQKVVPAFFVLTLVGVGGSLPKTGSAQTLSELRAAHKAAFDPRAIQLLQQMADAYANVTWLDQKTEFYGLSTPMQGTGNSESSQSTADSTKPKVDPSPSESGTLPRFPIEKPLGRVVRLMVAEPNRLRLDVTEDGEADAPAKTASTVCDGKILYAYNPAKNWYTQEKAPRRLHDFLKAASLADTTLELWMMMGLNPFTDVQNQFDAVKYEGTQIVRGVQTDVVLMRNTSERLTQELRLYIDTDDALLRRIMVESTPIVRTLVPPKHDILDDLVARPVAPPPLPEAKPEVAPGFEDPHPIAPPGVPMYTRVTCDNIFTLNPRFEPDTFVFKPPKDAVMYQGINGRGDFSKLSSSQSVQELMRKLQSSKAVKKAKPVRLKP